MKLPNHPAAENSATTLVGQAGDHRRGVAGRDRSAILTRADSFVDRNPKAGFWMILSSGFVGFFGLWLVGVLGVPLDDVPRGSSSLLLALVVLFFTALSGFGRPGHPHPFLVGAAAVVFSALTGAFGLMTVLGLLPG